MIHPVVEEEGTQLILRAGTLPRPAAFASLALALPVIAWLLSEISAQLHAGAGLPAVAPLIVGALIALPFLGLGLFAPLASELRLDPERQRADLRERGLIGQRHRSWPLATLPVPQVRYDSASTDILPAWELRFTLPGPRPVGSHCLNFHFPGAASVQSHLTCEQRAAETLQVRIAGLIEEARSTGRVI